MRASARRACPRSGARAAIRPRSPGRSASIRARSASTGTRRAAIPPASPSTIVPVASLDAVARARPSADAFRKAFGGEHQSVFVYTRQTTHAGHHFHARMFAPSFGIPEDPATGSAAAAFAGVLMQFEPLGDGEHDFIIEQGYEMGRPSDIALQLVIERGRLASVEIGGAAVLVSEGTLRL